MINKEMVNRLLAMRAVPAKILEAGFDTTSTIFCDPTIEIILPSLSPVPLFSVGASWWECIQSWPKRRKWRLNKDYCLFIPGLNIWVKFPIGFVFDGASIPRTLSVFLSPTGILFISALVHDFGYRYNCLLDVGGNVIMKDIGKENLDIIFRDLAIFINRLKVLDNIAWLAVYLFGKTAWEKCRKKNESIEDLILIKNTND